MTEIERYQEVLEKNPTSRAFAPLAEAHRKAGDDQEAIRICRMGLEHHPNSATALVTLGRALLAIADTEAAKDALEKATQLSPENLHGQRLLAQVLRSCFVTGKTSSEVLYPAQLLE